MDLNNIIDIFFRDLKQYNSTNFRTILRADLAVSDATICKAFSSVVTRYFIFCERRKDEFSSLELRLLFYKLKIDMIARFFSEYPEGDIRQLIAFQCELRNYVNDSTNPLESVPEGDEYSNARVQATAI